MLNAFRELFEFPSARTLLNLTCGRRKASKADAGCGFARRGEARESEWSLTLHKREGDVLGVGLGNASTGAVIFNIPEGGLLDQWNAANLPRRLYPGQVITEVNGVRGYWAILEELQGPGELNLRISDQPPAHAGPRWFEDIAAMGRSLEKQNRDSGSGGSSFMLRLRQEGPNAACQFSSLPNVVAGECGVDQCAICIDDVGPDDSLLLLPCNHAYHPLCVARWLTQGASCGSSKHSCPLCCRRMVNSREGIVAVGADDPSASWPLSRPRRFRSRLSTR